ncbi:MAG: hypothetical protein EBU81_09975 [Proteobacteria bacterium]|nr:hypothetical protein [Pseudomonadota bacterium]
MGTMATEKRLLELRIKDLEHRLFGSSSEKLPIEDRQLALIDEVFDHPEPATTQDVVVDPDIEKRSAKKPVRRPLPGSALSMLRPTTRTTGRVTGALCQRGGT